MKKSFIFIAAVVLIFSLNSCGPSACDCMEAAMSGDDSMKEDCQAKNYTLEDLADCK